MLFFVFVVIVWCVCVRKKWFHLLNWKSLSLIRGRKWDLYIWYMVPIKVFKCIKVEHSSDIFNSDSKILLLSFAILIISITHWANRLPQCQTILKNKKGITIQIVIFFSKISKNPNRVFFVKKFIIPFWKIKHLITHIFNISPINRSEQNAFNQSYRQYLNWLNAKQT